MDQVGREAFGAFLRGLREAKGLTQRKAGELAKVSNPYLAQLEKGQRNPPSRDVLARLARVYGVSEEKMLQEAGYSDRSYTAVPPERIEWAFECVKRDPDFTFGNRLRGHELNLATKAFIVELYQRATGRNLLDEAEAQAIEEMNRGHEEASGVG